MILNDQDSLSLKMFGIIIALEHQPLVKEGLGGWYFGGRVVFGLKLLGEMMLTKMV